MTNKEVKELVKKYKIKRELSFEGRMMVKQLTWLKVAIAMFIIQIGFYAVAIYELLQLIK